MRPEQRRGQVRPGLVVDAVVGRPARVWPHLIEENRVRSALDKNVNANLLWNIATLELLAEAHFDGE